MGSEHYSSLGLAWFIDWGCLESNGGSDAGMNQTSTQLVTPGRQVGAANQFIYAKHGSVRRSTFWANRINHKAS